MSISTVSKKHFRTCNLCEAMCGLEIAHDGEKVISIKGDADDPFSKGFICPKGAMMGELYSDPDRLKKPLRKTKEGFKEIAWEEAFDLIAEKINSIRNTHGNNAVATYFGNPTVHNYGAMLFAGEFKKAIRTQNSYSATSMDQLPHHFAAHFMLGSGMLMPIPDINRTEYMLILGANPVASNGSIMTAAGVPGKLKDIISRGGKTVVLDPRRTETAKIASEHHFIKPDSDVFFLLAMLYVIVDKQAIKPGHLAPFLAGTERILKLHNPITPQVAEEKTGIPAEDISRITADYCNTPKAVIYGRMGVSTQSHGGLCHWLINLINILTGHFDVPGGAMFTKPAVPVIREKKGHNVHARWQSRVRGLPEFESELPVSVMVEEMTTPGDGQIKALIVNAGNIVLSTPDGGRMDQALSKLDFMVAIDIYLNETTKHADIILPPTTGLEVDHYDLVFNTFAVSNTAKFSEALFPPKDGQLHDWQIFKALTKRLSKKKLPLMKRMATPKLLLGLGFLTGPYGKFSGISNLFGGLSLGKVRKSRHGIDLGPLVSMLPGSLKTKNGKIELAPTIFTDGLARLISEQESQAKQTEEFALIGRRHLRSNNSWLHNTEKLMKGKNRCTMMIHSSDARRLEINDKEIVTVRSAAGEINIETEITDDLMPGVVSIPHGFGHHKKGIKLAVASKYAGVSLNDITDHNQLDELTGNAAFSGVRVDILKVMKPELANQN
ncbi:MAG: molybdopterin-dependent oxidoreductase [Cyclobacteriaceae bacterium]